MLSQLSAPTSDRFDIRSIPTPTIYEHLVTLIRHSTGAEVSFKVETTSDRYTDVSREIAHQKVMRGLVGYSIFEVLDLNNPF